uniref:Uncharacterized protein n=1 Tax=Arundo donax TaxID=35708 RepID=A0A0A9CX57_ARUDO
MLKSWIITFKKSWASSLNGGTSVISGICESFSSHLTSMRTRYLMSPNSLKKGIRSLIKRSYRPSSGESAIRQNVSLSGKLLSSSSDLCVQFRGATI